MYNNYDKYNLYIGRPMHMLNIIKNDVDSAYSFNCIM